ncbi:hypothetical protein EVAR_102401_1 [Eumeta japonica]|uniref:Uncharacterized protein n=1 Tax=Eumeta variegata TaxID=151549 RepID=A0A4C1SMA3_EUMVA|nr:hypothetical protein EVAR_102401_1 [Eumeta japonica]
MITLRAARNLAYRVLVSLTGNIGLRCRLKPTVHWRCCMDTYSSLYACLLLTYKTTEPSMDWQSCARVAGTAYDAWLSCLCVRRATSTYKYITCLSPQQPATTLGAASSLKAIRKCNNFSCGVNTLQTTTGTLWCAKYKVNKNSNGGQHSGRNKERDPIERSRYRPRRSLQADLGSGAREWRLTAECAAAAARADRRARAAVRRARHRSDAASNGRVRF